MGISASNLVTKAGEPFVKEDGKDDGKPEPSKDGVQESVKDDGKAVFTMVLEEGDYNHTEILDTFCLHKRGERPPCVEPHLTDEHGGLEDTEVKMINTERRADKDKKICDRAKAQRKEDTKRSELEMEGGKSPMSIRSRKTRILTAAPPMPRSRARRARIQTVMLQKNQKARIITAVKTN